jgi:methionyl-tRNA formyltransferase
MKLAFFGTSDFAVPILQKLLEAASYEIGAVVTQPDRPAGRSKKMVSSPVKKWAVEKKVPVFQPESLLDDDDLLEKLAGCELFVLASYGEIIPKKYLQIPRFGFLNVHPSLLPKYRGASPIQAAILNGDFETGVTIIRMDELLDHGAIVAKAAVNLTGKRFGYRQLHDELAKLGAQLLVKVLPEYLDGQIKPVPQEEAQATFTQKISKKNVRIDWRDSAEAIDRMIRAFETWPVAWTTLEGQLLKIYEVVPLSLAQDPKQPGQIVEAGPRLIVSCGQNSGTKLTFLQIKSLQAQGARRLPSEEFLNGHRNLEAKILG